MGEGKYKIIVFHPGQQHSFKVAKAMEDNGILYKYYTAIYDKPNSFAMRLAKKLVKADDAKKYSKRKISGFDDSKVELQYTFLSLAVIILSRRKFTQKLSLWLDRYICNRYGKKVAKKAIKNRVDAVICFYGNERTCFAYLKKHAPSIKRIVDCSCATYRYMRDIYDLDIQKYQSYHLKKEAKTFWSKKQIRDEAFTIKITDYFFSPSQFVANSLKYCGVKEEKIIIIPYGINFDIDEQKKREPTKIRFIYVGQVTHRKGMHHLLRAFAGIDNKDVSLDVVGAYDKTSTLYCNYVQDERIKFHGNVIHDEVRNLLRQADVFVFCSLTEGMSLSCMEALSCGLPLICSTNCGANDAIIDNENGFVVESDDTLKIQEKMRFFIDNKELLPEFSHKAKETARKYTWGAYGANIKIVLDKILISN